MDDGPVFYAFLEASWLDQGCGAHKVVRLYVLETDDAADTGEFQNASSNKKNEPGFSCAAPLLFLSEILYFDLGVICRQVQNTEKGSGMGNGGRNTIFLDLAAGDHLFRRRQCALACGTEKCLVWDLLLAGRRIRGAENAGVL